MVYVHPSLSGTKAYIEMCSMEKKIKLAPLLEDDQENGIVTYKHKNDFVIRYMDHINFKIACEQASFNSFFDYYTRFQLVYIPECAENDVCEHYNVKNPENIMKLPVYAVVTFNTEMDTSNWFEALEMCIICITPKQYLPANVLQAIVEIMLNAHDDDFAECGILELLNKCQTTLCQHFSTHPPCLNKQIRECYKDFLVSSMDPKAKTYSNRKEFEFEKGIVKYCMNRLEYEISAWSPDKPIVDKKNNVPSKLKDTVTALHWQKQKLEIYETLDRPERIDRLMRVLESIVELLQFDLAIYHRQSTKTNRTARNLTRTIRPLMVHVLWPNNDKTKTITVNDNCHQIMKLFAYLVHLQYTEEHIIIMTNWLLTMIQTFYIHEVESIGYPDMRKNCFAFAHEFYKILLDMPPDSTIRILERIQPTYMQHLIAKQYIWQLLSINEDCIITILINFLKYEQWNVFPKLDETLNITRQFILKPKLVQNVYEDILKALAEPDVSFQEDVNAYKKIDPNNIPKSEIYRNHVVHILFISLDAYLDAYNINGVKQLLDDLHNGVSMAGPIDVTCSLVNTSYSVTETFKEKYKHIFNSLKYLNEVFEEKSAVLPYMFTCFSKLGFDV